MVPYPRIPPDIITFGPFRLRWYGVMYVVGYAVGYRLVLARIRAGIGPLTQKTLDALVPYLVVGMLAGARLVYVFVYDFPQYRAHPLMVFAIWTGGLSFHGAILGMAAATLLFARRFHVRVLGLADTIALAGCPGLFFGRIGNFINGELYGRPTNVPWAMIFPTDPTRLPRHPSQLYEACAEGIVLFGLLWTLDRWARKRLWYWDGLLTGAFLVGYALIRFALEFTREPDAQLGLVVLAKFSMGQLLSAIMLVAGVLVLVLSLQKTRRERQAIELVPAVPL